MKLDVLLVEDDHMLARMLASMLRDEGHDVTCVTTAEDAASCVIKPDMHFHALVADVNLSSSVDGVEIAHFLRQQNKRAAIILMTGADTREIRRRVPDGSIILEKPFRPSELVEILAQQDWE